MRRPLPLPLALAALAFACSPRTEEVRATTGLLGGLSRGVWDVGFVDVGGPLWAPPDSSSWHPPLAARPDGSTWAWMRGMRSSLGILVEEPGDGVLEVVARTRGHLAEGQELTVLLNGRELGAGDVHVAPTVLSFPVSEDDLLHGLNRVELVAAREGPREPERIVADAPHSVAVDLVALRPPGSDGAGLPDLAARTPAEDGSLRLHPRQVARTGLTVPEEGRLALAVRSSGKGRLFLSVLDGEGGARLLEQPVEVGPDPRITYVDLAPLARRHVVLTLGVPGDATPVSVIEAKVEGLRSGTNVILVVVDTLRADYVLGGHGVETPAIERLAADGIRFDLALAHAPLTLPSHTALFSSRYPHVNGVTNNGQPVDAEVPLLADWLAQAGYHTSAVISIGTLWTRFEDTGVDRGFADYDDQTRDLPQAHRTRERLWPVLGELGKKEPFLLFAHFSDPHSPYNSHGTRQLSAELALDGEVVAREDLGDMKTWIHTQDVSAGGHRFELRGDGKFRVRRLDVSIGGRSVDVEFEGSGTNESTASLAVRFESEEAGEAVIDLWVHDTPGAKDVERRYRLEVGHVDRVLAEMLDELDRLGLYDDSLIVFTGDHGEGLGEHGILGHANGLWEEQLRVPLIVKPPVGHEARARLQRMSSRLVRHVDVVPTVLDFLGLPPIPGQMGVSLLVEQERVHFAETHRPESQEDLLVLRDERYKLFYRPASDSFAMYDIVEDPDEEHDVFAEKGNERAPWQEQLRVLARGRVAFDRSGVDADVEAMLQALGY